ncbi:hypothetical protein PHPALM_30204, partial [Phytophthora palmivora]
MAFARLSGRLELPVLVPVTSTRGPIGKQAAYAAAGKDPPTSDGVGSSVNSTPARRPTPPDEAVSVDNSSVSTVLNTPGSVVDVSVALPACTRPTNTIPDATEQVSLADGANPEATAQTTPCVYAPVANPDTIPNATEEDRTMVGPIPDHTDDQRRWSTTDVEESKSETDETDDVVDFEVFDGENFMEGLLKEKLFGPVAADDVNVVTSADLSDSDSDADNEDVIADNEVAPAPVEGAEDLIDETMNDDDVDMELLGLTEQYLRDIANWWEVYDEDQSGNLLVDQATDYYNGPCGPTRSAVAYADSPLGMFFYFLPKELWVRIADESNRYREQNIIAVATSRRNKLLARQAKDPRISVPNLEEIEENLAKFK